MAASITAINPVEILKKLTNDEKAKLLSGEDMWHTAPISRLELPKMSDGPNGVRGTAWTNAAPAACFPCATALAASFDTGLLERVEVALGRECRARGGLSYTQFQYGSLSIKPTQFGCTVSLYITNVGQVDGDESCQVYVHAYDSEIVRLKLELGEFAKVALQAGETKRVSVGLDHKAFSFYDTARLMWRARRGANEMHIGRSASEIAASAPFLLDKSFIWKGLDTPTIIS